MRNPTEHFYNEIYSYYYSVVGRLISVALKGELTPEKEEEILYENSSFSGDLILDKLHVFNEWFLMSDKLKKMDDSHIYETDIECEYRRPVTTLEKRWLKSIISDPRIQLFDLGFVDTLKDVEPLFSLEDFVSVGVFNDGDKFDDSTYIKNFRTVIKAIKDGWALSIISENRYGEVSPIPYTFVPDHIEYSEIEDKFSIYGYSPGGYGNSIIRMGRVKTCELCANPANAQKYEEKKGKLTILLDEDSARTQNALERILIEFSHYTKKVRETEEGAYIIELEYVIGEEQELAVLRLMPFAHYIRVLSPDSIKQEIKSRISRQSQLLRIFSDI